LRNIIARSRNHVCCGTALNITYYECVFVALVIQHAMRIRRVLHCYLWPVCLYHIFPHFFKPARFSGNVAEHKIFLGIRLQIFPKHFSF